MEKRIKKYLEEKSQEIAEEWRYACEDIIESYEIKSPIEQLFFIEFQYIKRERDLMNEGYKIMRFSGREIVRDVEKCVEEVIDYFLKPR